jgi:hypothetical protein
MLGGLFPALSGRGILIIGFIGGNSNSTTGDSSVGIIGRLFEKGEFTPTRSGAAALRGRRLLR